MNKQQVIIELQKIIKACNNGDLGGEIMPEDVHPNLPKDSADNCFYFAVIEVLS
jgi:hypothetical protein